MILVLLDAIQLTYFTEHYHRVDLFMVALTSLSMVTASMPVIISTLCPR